MTTTIVLLLAAIGWLVAAETITRRLRRALREHTIDEAEAIERVGWALWCLIASLGFMAAALFLPA